MLTNWRYIDCDCGHTYIATYWTKKCPECGEEVNIWQSQSGGEK